MGAFQEMADVYFIRLQEFVASLLDLPAVPLPESIKEFDLVRSQEPLEKLLPVLQNNFIAMSDTLVVRWILLRTAKTRLCMGRSNFAHRKMKRSR